MARQAGIRRDGRMGSVNQRVTTTTAELGGQLALVCQTDGVSLEGQKLIADIGSAPARKGVPATEPEGDSADTKLGLTVLVLTRFGGEVR
jgi:hypothetical protein